MGRPLRVLFIEDTEDDALVILRELRRAGFTPEWRLVADAGALAAALAEPWDVALCDYTIPGFGALQALAVVAEHRPELPVLVVSGSVGEEHAVEAMRAGAADFVLKDRLSRLAPAVGRELEAAKLRAARQRAEEALARSEKLYALGQMATGIAHDLKNLLNPLGLHLEIVDRALRRAGADRPDVIATMRDIIDRGVETIDRLRAFARQEPEAPRERFALARLVHEAIEIVQPRLGERPGVELVERVDDEVAMRGNRGDVIGATVNLLGNAIDAVGERGRITVDVGGDEAAAWVIVGDDGPGMTEEVADRVFEPFYSTKGEHGTGLGLPNVFAAMRRHGGEVLLDTAPGRGARFTLRFPR